MAKTEGDQQNEHGWSQWLATNYHSFFFFSFERSTHTHNPIGGMIAL